MAQTVTNEGGSTNSPSAKHQRISLPSRCVFYPKVDDVYVRRLHIVDLDSLSTAKNKSSIRDFVEALGRTLHGIDVLDMTWDDFVHLCYWHRINSFPRRAYKLSWKCENPEHIRVAYQEQTDDMTDEEKDVITRSLSTINNVYDISMGSLTIREITEERFEALSAFITSEDVLGNNLYLHPVTCSDHVEAAEFALEPLRGKKLSSTMDDEGIAQILDDMVDASQNDLLITTACVLSPLHGATLLDRMEFLTVQAEENPDFFGDALLEVTEQFEELSYHGVDESHATKCRGCGQAVTLNSDFDLFSFFPRV